MTNWAGARRVRGHKRIGTDMKVHTSIVEEANRPKKIKGDSSKEKRRSFIEEKGFMQGGFACIPSDQTPRKILEVTDAAQLRLEGIAYDVTPCTALPAEKPKKNKRK